MSTVNNNNEVPVTVKDLEANEGATSSGSDQPSQVLPPARTRWPIELKARRSLSLLSKLLRKESVMALAGLGVAFVMVKVVQRTSKRQKKICCLRANVVRFWP